MSTSGSDDTINEEDGDDAIGELIDEYADVVSELAGRDSPFAERLRQLRDEGRK